MRHRSDVLTDLSPCTVQVPDGGSCGQQSSEGMPFPICGHHATRLYRHLIKLMSDYDSQPLVRLQMTVDAIEERVTEQARRVAARPPKVYYVQVGELIKIGYTTDLKQRIRSYPPTSRLLATEPGGIGLERQRHKQFRDLLIHGSEWFRPGSALTEHIASLADHG